MSIARVKTVQRSRKALKCGKCGDELPAGSTYRHYTVGFRSHFRRIRCMKPTCTPRTSELESSRMSEAYSAQEEAEDALAGLRDSPGDDSDIDEVVTNFAGALTDLAQEYRDADEQFGGGGNTASGERADELDEAASGLDSFGVEPFAGACEKHLDNPAEPDEKCADCDEACLEWWNGQVEAAESAVSEVAL